MMMYAKKFGQGDATTSAPVLAETQALTQGSQPLKSYTQDRASFQALWCYHG